MQWCNLLSLHFPTFFLKISLSFSHLLGEPKDNSGSALKGDMGIVKIVKNFLVSSELAYQNSMRPWVMKNCEILSESIKAVSYTNVMEIPKDINPTIASKGQLQRGKENVSIESVFKIIRKK